MRFLTLFESENKAPEFAYYFGEVFEGSAENYQTMRNEIIKGGGFRLRAQFTYKGTRNIDVWMMNGVGGGMSVTIYEMMGEEDVYGDWTGGTKKLDDNAFYNDASKSVNYDPVCNEFQHAWQYVKSVLDKEDRDRDYSPSPTPASPRVKKPQLVGV